MPILRTRFPAEDFEQLGAAGAPLHLFVAVEAAHPNQRHPVGDHQVSMVEHFAKVGILARLRNSMHAGNSDVTGAGALANPFFPDPAFEDLHNIRYLDRIHPDIQHTKTGNLGRVVY